MFCKNDGSAQICSRAAAKFVKKKQPKECTILIKFEENTSVNYSFHEGAKLNNKSTVNFSQTTLPEAMQGKGVITFC